MQGWGDDVPGGGEEEGEEGVVVEGSSGHLAAIKRAKRPVLVIGIGMMHLDWALELAKDGNIPIDAGAGRIVG